MYHCPPSVYYAQEDELIELHRLFYNLEATETKIDAERQKQQAEMKEKMKKQKN